MDLCSIKPYSFTQKPLRDVFSEITHVHSAIMHQALEAENLLAVAEKNYCGSEKLLYFLEKPTCETTIL